MYSTSLLQFVAALWNVAKRFPQHEEVLQKWAGEILNPSPIASATPTEVLAAELLAGKNVGKIEAIKKYRTRTGLGLKESKDNVERAMEQLGISFGGYY